jgi:hypothetical protein
VPPMLSTVRCPPPARSESIRSASLTVSEVSIAASAGVMDPPLSRMAESSSRSLLAGGEERAHRRLAASWMASAKSATAGIISPNRAEHKDETQTHLDVVKALLLAPRALNLAQRCSTITFSLRTLSNTLAQNGSGTVVMAVVCKLKVRARQAMLGGPLAADPPSICTEGGAGREALWRPHGPRRTQSLRQDPTAQVGCVAVEDHLGATFGQQ